MSTNTRTSNNDTFATLAVSSSDVLVNRKKRQVPLPDCSATPSTTTVRIRIGRRVSSLKHPAQRRDSQKREDHSTAEIDAIPHKTYGPAWPATGAEYNPMRYSQSVGPWHIRHVPSKLLGCGTIISLALFTATLPRPERQKSAALTTWASKLKA